MTKSYEHRAIGSFKFDINTKELRDASGQIVALRPQTSNILSLLLSREGELVTKDELMDEVWKDTHVTDDSLVQCISEIRKALGPEAGKLLTTVPKKGYRLSADAALAAPTETAIPFSRRRVAAVVAALFLAALIAFLALREPPNSGTKTIAVLPFTSMSGELEQDYFSQGLAEDLLTDLSKIEALTVLSRASTFVYSRNQRGLQEIAQELGASHVIDGSVRRDGDRIRISVQLVDAGSGASLWAERYDREVGGLFELQDELRSQIIAALAVRLAPGDAERLHTGGTSAFTAYDLLLKGRFEESALTRAGMARAIRYYEQAIEIDPAYADAYARMANMYDFLVRFGWSDEVERDRLRALSLAEKAVALDERNPFVHWTHGRVLSRLGNEGAKSQVQAIEALQRAIELDPKYADAYAFISLLYVGSGRPEDASKAMAKALELNPEFPFWYVQNRAIIRYMEEDFEAAIADLEHAAEQNPTAVFVRWWLAAAYAQAGRQDDADWQLEEMKALGFASSVSEIVKSTSVIEHPPYAALFAEGLRKAGIPD
jgi:TolB-like protein/DNA-binding winged helix-turn-helix (wHTH) protein/Tfp pilus assembly protein PilF